METAEGQGWSIGKFREQVLRAGCRVAWARPDDDLPHRPIRRRVLVEAAGSLETVHSPDGVAVARPPQRPYSSVVISARQCQAPESSCAKRSFRPADTPKPA